MKAWMVFAFSAALFWGAYVPTIIAGQKAFGMANPNKAMRAFLFIGLAYFLMAVIVPGIWLMTHSSDADAGFTMRGGILSTLAGALGAAGALAVVFAGSAGGSPMYVASVVFGGAPIVNVLISYLLDFLAGKAQAPHPLFFVGLLLAVTGVAMVLLNNPAAHGPPAKSASSNKAVPAADLPVAAAPPAVE